MLFAALLPEGWATVLNFASCPVSPLLERMQVLRGELLAETSKANQNRCLVWTSIRTGFHSKVYRC